MAYDKMWSAEYVKQHPGGFHYEGYSTPLIDDCRKKKTDSYSGFIESIYREIVSGVERGCDYDFIILHNLDDFEMLSSLRNDLQDEIDKIDLDCLVFSSPKGKGEVEGNGNYLVDVGWFVENGWLGDLDERVNTRRQIV